VESAQAPQSEFAERLMQLVYVEHRNGISSIRGLARAIVKQRAGRNGTHAEVENVRRQLTRIMKQGQTPEEGTVENIRRALGVSPVELPTPPSAKALGSRVSRLEQQLAAVQAQVSDVLAALRELEGR
jgi:hypothetical protein